MRQTNTRMTAKKQVECDIEFHKKRRRVNLLMGIWEVGLGGLLVWLVWGNQYLVASIFVLMGYTVWYSVQAATTSQNLADAMRANQEHFILMYESSYITMEVAEDDEDRKWM